MPHIVLHEAHNVVTLTKLVNNHTYRVYPYYLEVYWIQQTNTENVASHKVLLVFS